MVNPLDAIIFGMLKHARQEADRERYGNTRSKRVGPLPTHDVVASTPAPDEILDRQERRWRVRRHALRLLREYTSNPRHQRLLIRRLLYGESIVAVAAELQVRPGTARSVVMRGRKYFGLKD